MHKGGECIIYMHNEVLEISAKIKLKSKNLNHCKHEPFPFLYHSLLPSLKHPSHIHINNNPRRAPEIISIVAPICPHRPKRENDKSLSVWPPINLVTRRSQTIIP